MHEFCKHRDTHSYIIFEMREKGFFGEKTLKKYDDDYLMRSQQYI